MRMTKRGFTLIEILIAMAIAGLIMGVVGSAFYYLMVVPPEQSDRLTATNELRFTLEWIQRDGVQAQNFTINQDYCLNYPDNPNNYYGYFCSRDDPNDPECCIEVYYKYSNVTQQLIREETICSASTSPATPLPPMTLSSHIVNCGDVIFYCGGDDKCEGNNPLTVSITVILNPGTPNEISETDTRYIEMRAAQ